MLTRNRFSRTSSHDRVKPRSSSDSSASTSDTSDENDKDRDGPRKSLSDEDRGHDGIASSSAVNGDGTSQMHQLSEPLSERSLAAYLFYQLKWFDPSLPDSTIASQGGILTAAFAAAQFITAVWWGRAADTPWIGRKKVLLIGLTGTAIASIGVGFSKTFYQALFFRALAGCLNAISISCFLLLPMCFNVGVVIGPILGGFLADPVQSFPHTFGPGSVLGGRTGVAWMIAFPYALPNLFSGIFILISALSVVFGLDETHEALRNKRDRGRALGRMIVGLLGRRTPTEYTYTQVASEDAEMQTLTRIPSTSGTTVFPRSVPNPQPSTNATSKGVDSRKKSPPLEGSPFRQILRKNVLLTLVSHHLLAFHVSAFSALIFLLLPAPRSANTSYHSPSLRFTGGIGLSQEKVGLAMAILGVIGLPLQLLVYPPVNNRLGTLRGYRLFLPFSFLAYIALPFLVLLPESPPWLVWILLTVVLASQVLSRTFALAGTVILVNNSSPHPSTLGTVHGVAQSVSSLARMLGPTLSGWVLGLGLKGNLVGGVWWAIALIAFGNWLLLLGIYEGDGYGGKA